MAETIRMDGSLRDPSTHFVSEAMCFVGREDQVKVFDDGRQDGTVDVEFRVNGVEFPFEKTIRKVYQLIEASIDARAAQIAYDNARLQGLDKLREAVESADWQIRQKIEEAFGVELGGY